MEFKSTWPKAIIITRPSSLNDLDPLGYDGSAVRVWFTAAESLSLWMVKYVTFKVATLMVSENVNVRFPTFMSSSNPSKTGFVVSLI